MRILLISTFAFCLSLNACRADSLEEGGNQVYLTAGLPARVEIFDQQKKLLFSDEKAKIIPGPDKELVYVLVSKAEELEKLTKENLRKKLRIEVNKTHINELIIASPLASGVITLNREGK
jgi:hypothetical protein